MKKQNQVKSKNKSIVLGIILLLLVMIILLGIAYGYYRTRVVGNSEDKTIDTPTKLLQVEYEDNSPTVVTDNKFEPGKKLEKSFKVNNTGDDVGNYSIILDNIENENERTWDIRYSLKNANNEVLVKGTLGKELTQQMVYADIEIDATKTDEYTLELEYENPDEDQSIDMGKSLSFKIDIIEAHENIFENLANENTLLYAIGRDNEVVKQDSVPAVGKYAIGEIDNKERTIELDGNKYYTWGNEIGIQTLAYATLGIKNVQNTTVSELSEMLNQGDIYVADIKGNDTAPTVGINKEVSIAYKIIKIEESETEGKYKITYKIYDKVFDGDATGKISFTEDDYGTSYYYRNIVKNNYVTFNNMCWRIVRVLGNGDIKITLYDETKKCEDITEPNPTGSFINGGTKYKFKESSETGNVIYENSNAKKELENWYEKKFNTEAISKNIKEAEWCNDVSLTTDEQGNIVSGPFKRWDNPSLKCNFSSSAELNGPKALKVKSSIGLLTSDEVVFAGGLSRSLSDGYWLTDNTDHSWFTMGIFHKANIYQQMSVGARGLGYVGEELYNSVNLGYLRPSLVISKSVTLEKGNGTLENPYVISTN